MSTISLNGHNFSYTITRKPVMRLSLRIRSRRSLAISAPLFTPDFVVKKFVVDHADWILIHAQKHIAKKPLKRLKKLKINDIEYQILLTKSKMDSVVIFKDEQKIYANSSSLATNHLKKLFDVKLRPLALSIIIAELTNLSRQFGFSYGRVTVRNTTSRFGSCSAQNNLNFNWQIVLLPSAVFRHILLHELTHTIHHNHSSRFWNHLASCDPLWRAHRRYLKTQAHRHFIV
jgi:predicted metal-dependent hydrolase